MRWFSVEEIDTCWNPKRFSCGLRYGVATNSRLLQIIGLFAKEPYKRDDILQKRPIILRSLLIVATPEQGGAASVFSFCVFDCLEGVLRLSYVLQLSC